jgi:hypothetical protein
MQKIESRSNNTMAVVRYARFVLYDIVDPAISPLCCLSCGLLTYAPAIIYHEQRFVHVHCRVRFEDALFKRASTMRAVRILTAIACWGPMVRDIASIIVRIWLELSVLPDELALRSLAGPIFSSAQQN